MAKKQSLTEQQIINLALTQPNMLLGKNIKHDCAYCGRKNQKICSVNNLASVPGINEVRITSECACKAIGHSQVQYYNGNWHYSGINIWFSPEYIKMLDEYLSRPDVRQNIKTVKKYLTKHINAQNK